MLQFSVPHICISVKYIGAPVPEEAVNGVGDAREVGAHQPRRLADLKTKKVDGRNEMRDTGGGQE